MLAASGNMPLLTTLQEKNKKKKNQEKFQKKRVVWRQHGDIELHGRLKCVTTVTHPFLTPYDMTRLQWH
jgi:hypothetical protein